MSNNPINTSEFIRLLTNHQTALRGFIISILPGCQDINDILQDTNVVLWEKMNSYQPGSNFRSWAFAVAKNKVMQYWDKQKKQKKQNKLIISEELILAVAEAKKNETPEHLENKLSALNLCLTRLTSNDRQLVEARYTHSDTLETYATTAGRPAASIRVSLCRIRKKLRECIDKRIALEGGVS